MAELISFKITGQRAFDRKVKQTIKAIGPVQTGKILLRNANGLRDDVRAVTPRDVAGKTQQARTGVNEDYDKHIGTGTLRQSVMAKLLRAVGGVIFAIVGFDYRISSVAHLVERGHGGENPAPPHPFFRPIVDEKGPGVLRQTVSEMKDAVIKAWNK